MAQVILSVECPICGKISKLKAFTGLEVDCPECHEPLRGVAVSREAGEALKMRCVPCTEARHGA